ncbi:MAG: NosD domain-containing protein [Bacillota bacterium]
MGRRLAAAVLLGLIVGIAGIGTALAAEPATISLGTDGWTSLPDGWSDFVGWDPSTHTGWLNQDLYARIMIVSNDVTLDGNGFTLAGDNTGDGVTLWLKSGVVVKNLKIREFTRGIYLVNSHCNSISGNTVAKNVNGIWLQGSSNNTITGNILQGNTDKGIHLMGSAGNTISSNTATDGSYGIWLQGSPNNTVTGNTASGNTLRGIQLANCTGNTVSGNTASNNACGIWLQGCQKNNIAENNLRGNSVAGIHFMGCSENTFSGNLISGGGKGIHGQGSGSNTLNRNSVSGCDCGLSLLASSGHDIYNNTITGNCCGLSLWNSSNNRVYNNNFIGNSVQALVGLGTGNVFNLDRPAGGNYWSNWTGPDTNGDGFVDSPYVFERRNRLYYGQDNLPWTRENGWLDAYTFEGFLPPLDSDGATFRLGRSIPVKFRLRDANGDYVADAGAALFLVRVVNGIPGEEIDAVSASKSVHDNFFRYSPGDNLYIFNLDTKDLSVGTWRLRTALDDGTSHHVTIVLE